MSEQETPKVQRIIAVFWPSFLTAGLATVLFFTAFDPQEIMLVSGYGNVSRIGGYTVGFFLLWILTASACGLTCYFQRPCDKS